MSETKEITYSKCPCGDPYCDQYIMSNQRSVGFSLEDAQLFKAAPKMREALDKAFEFIKSEYHDPRAQALEGSYVSAEARPVWDAICEALAEVNGQEDPK